MILTLDNGTLRVEVDSFGSELHSVRYKNTERLWNGNPEIWGRRAPVLFPFIGRLMNEEYILNGKAYHCPIHGFAIRKEFQVDVSCSTYLRLSLSEDEETLAYYPFSFRLEIEFELMNNTLIKRHRVINLSDSPMPYEIGGHEAYSTVIVSDDQPRDYIVEFEGMNAIEPFGMESGTGMLTLPKTRVELQSSCLTKRPADLGLDTIILDDFSIRKAKLFSAKSGLSVTIDFRDFRFLGIWTKPREYSGYLCIEPWSSLPDGHFMSRNIMERRGIRVLQAGESEVLSYTATFE